MTGTISVLLSDYWTEDYEYVLNSNGLKLKVRSPLRYGETKLEIGIKET